ncbi:twist-related protein 1-like [Macrobrachium nipponense]|uniref:twist-related protein 1-like n=1 Tax=Macrobrachium nipponense TaxID=159736 RepID=UPI0030C805C7
MAGPAARGASSSAASVSRGGDSRGVVSRGGGSRGGGSRGGGSRGGQGLSAGGVVSRGVVSRDGGSRGGACPSSLLEISTKKAPFADHRNYRYTQIDDVAMGSPFRVLFTNFDMGTVEERVFQNSSKLRMYVRYIDDTFACADSQDEIEQLRCAFHDHSCLTFTIEHYQDRPPPFH